MVCSQNLLVTSENCKLQTSCTGTNLLRKEQLKIQSNEFSDYHAMLSKPLSFHSDSSSTNVHCGRQAFQMATVPAPFFDTLFPWIFLQKKIMILICVVILVIILVSTLGSWLGLS